MKFLFLVLFFISVKCVDFSYYDLALQKCNHNYPFSIHGLWPEYNIHSWPQFCNKTEYSEFNKTKLSEWSKIPEMNQYWYTCEHQHGMDNWSFWKHEWEKHGTCTNLNITEFFEIALNLFTDNQENIKDCCNENWLQCLVKFDKNFNYQNSCHTLLVGDQNKLEPLISN